jgi:hypothetical protein
MKTQWKHKISALLAGLFVLVISQSQAADTNIQRYSTEVQANVNADENIKAPISSYLNRELRSLNDVSIVESNPEWIIDITASELTYSSGQKTGAVAISIVITSPYRNKALSSMLQPNYKDFGLRLTSNLVHFYSHWLFLGSTDDLQMISKRIVTSFDTQILEDQRKLFRQAQEEFKTSK